MPLQQAPRTVTVTVTSGSGSTQMDFGGACIGYAVKPPQTGDSYDIEVKDERAFGVAGEIGLVGQQTIKDEFQLYRLNTVYIQNASRDGSYSVRFWFKP